MKDLKPGKLYVVLREFWYFLGDVPIAAGYSKKTTGETSKGEIFMLVGAEKAIFNSQWFHRLTFLFGEQVCTAIFAFTSVQRELPFFKELDSRPEI